MSSLHLSSLPLFMNPYILHAFVNPSEDKPQPEKVVCSFLPHMLPVPLSSSLVCFALLVVLLTHSSTLFTSSPRLFWFGKAFGHAIQHLSFPIILSTNVYYFRHLYQISSVALLSIQPTCLCGGKGILKAWRTLQRLCW